MNQKEILLKTEKYVRQLLEKEGSGHDWHHIQRVYNNALLIMQNEKCDEFLVKTAVLLHDIGDYKLHNGTDKTNDLVHPFLKSLNAEDIFIEKVIAVIKQIGFGENKNSVPTSIEAKIAQDADRLDAIGAIGIARTFQYGGYKGTVLYDPNITPVKYSSSKSYKKSTAPTINHFYEKLLLIKDLMNTDTARKIAQQRHDFMEFFLAQFYEEWEGKK
ncbi:MAG: HD domain-containing protein [Flavobacteriales bacterium]